MENLQYFSIPTIMSIAGSDSGGGAGIQADIKTAQALNGYATNVITALTAQNTKGVDTVIPIDPDFIEKQFISIVNDINIDAVKIGMLYDENTIIKISELLKRYKINNIVLDPVMVATSGDKLTKGSTINAMIKYLIPISKIITPNLFEAGMLLERKIQSLQEMTAAAEELLNLGCEAVIIKGGHLAANNENKICDVLKINSVGNTIVFWKNKIETKNLHGTGCTLSAALATHLARGHSIENAFYESQKYINSAIEKSVEFKIGSGNGPLQHNLEIR